MFNLIIFLCFFLLISVLFDKYCNYRMDGLLCAFPTKRFLSLDLKSIFFLSLLLLIPSVLIAFRSEETGIDTGRYLALFNDANNLMLPRMEKSTEFFYWQICYFFWKIDCIRGAFFVFAFIGLLFPFAAMYKLAPRANPLISCFVYLLLFYQEYFNAMRQMPAVALTFFAFSFALSRNFIPFFFCVLSASFFHTTALFALPIYFMYPLKPLNSWSFFKRIVCFMLIIFAATYMVDYFLHIEIFHRFEKYSDSMYQVTLDQCLKNFCVFYLPLIVLLLFFCIQNKLYGDTEKKESNFLWSSIFIFSSFILLRYVQNWFLRLGYYYQIAEIILVGIICKRKVLVNKISLLDRYISSSDIIVLYSIFSYFCFNLMYYDVSALVNFELM